MVKDTAIYGVSSIVGRFLNYLLVPIYVTAMSARSGGYGVVTEVYAWVALLMVILTYGMETTFFRYVNKAEENPRRVYSTTLIMVGSTSLLFVALGLAFLSQIAGAMGYADHPSYIGMMMGVVAMDAFQCIPFAYLRYRKRPFHFVALKLLFIVLNIALNIVYYVFLGGSDVAYAFLFNLVCTGTIMLLMLPLIKLGGGFDWQLAKRMLNYSYPILILGIAGILNQVADKIIFSHVYVGSDAKMQLKHVIAPNPEYWAGLRVVPIVMAAEILMGVYFNLSFWYKLIDKTLWGALFSFVGCAVLIAMNVLLVPKFGYMACAWAGVAGYGVAMVMSYIVGQKKNPIDYDLKSILSYVAVAAVLYFVAEYLKVGNTMLQLVVNTAMLCVFAMMIVKKEHLNIGAMLRRGRK